MNIRFLFCKYGLTAIKDSTHMAHELLYKFHSPKGGKAKDSIFTCCGTGLPEPNPIRDYDQVLEYFTVHSLLLASYNPICIVCVMYFMILGRFCYFIDNMSPDNSLIATIS